MGESQGFGCIMGRPPLYSTVRVNLRKKTVQEARALLQDVVSKDERSKHLGVPVVEVHEVLPDLLVIVGCGPLSWVPHPLEIYVDRSCGNSIIRGAELYAKGILGSNRSFTAGERCSIWMDVEKKCLKGWCRNFDGTKIFLGNGLIRVDRKDTFNATNKAPIGVGIAVTEPVWRQISLNRLFGDWGFPQNLPSVLCGHVLGCQPGEKVLDMCAVPGGKSTHIAQLMQDKGSVTCLDQNLSRLRLLEQNSEALGLHSLRTFHFDATKVLCQDGHCGSDSDSPPFPHEVFDRILVDAPCSGLGQRPLPLPFNDAQIKSFPVLQRKILSNAVYLLRKGGSLVYSTCTLIEEENECQIRWLLDKFPCMHLVPQEPHIGLPPTLSVFLCADEAALIQTFDPRNYCELHSDRSCLIHSKTALGDLYRWRSKQTNLGVSQDTNGFFIAKFEKREHTSTAF